MKTKKTAHKAALKTTRKTGHKTVEDLLVLVSKTTLMQHLQTLVIRGNPWWIGGIMPQHKFAAFANKRASRYPLLRTERGRTYDRSINIATMHFVAFAIDNKIAWWILSSDGKGGLRDESTEDYRVAKHAMAADSHIMFDGYVLLYAHKKDARTVTDAKTGRKKKVLKNMSTWTWKMTPQTMKEIRAVIQSEVKALNYGDDTHADKLCGVRGVLAFQRRRPLFSGVRSQVILLHREADDSWSKVRRAWLAKYSKYATQYGERAGRLRPMKEITSAHLPKMRRFKVFGEKTVGDLVA